MQDWAMSMIGYPAHRRAARPVVGLSHCHTHAALRLAEHLGWYTGWLVADSEQPQLVGLRPGEPVWMAIAEWFVDDRIPYTEGVISGNCTFVHATAAMGEPPSDRTLVEWAEEHQLAWFQVSDNEFSYWGGLDEQAHQALLTWFACQHLNDVDWRDVTMDQRLYHQLGVGLFAHGWTLNGELVQLGGLLSKTRCDLWGGVPQHVNMRIDRQGVPAFSQVQQGMRLIFKQGGWQGQLLTCDCPIKDEDGRLIDPLAK